MTIQKVLIPKNYKRKFINNKKFVPEENIILSGWDTDIEIEDLSISQHKSKDHYSFDYLNQKRQFHTIYEK